MSKVGVLNLWRSTNVYRLDFDTAVLTPGPMDPMELFGVVWRWLHESDMSAVSDFVFSCLLNFQSSVFMPRLPRHPGFEGKSIEPY